MRDNYAIQVSQAQTRFLTYDQEALIRKFALEADETYLYTALLGLPYRICRTTGRLEKQTDGVWADGNSHGEVLTLLDLLCDSRDDRHLSGNWKPMQNFGLMFHQNMLEGTPSGLALRCEKDPAWFRKACLGLGGTPLGGCDMGYAIEVFDGLTIGLRFWHADEDFPPQLRYFWDENALMYLRYETMWFAVGLLAKRLDGLQFPPDVL